MRGATHLIAEAGISPPPRWSLRSGWQASFGSRPHPIRAPRTFGLRYTEANRSRGRPSLIPRIPELPWSLSSSKDDPTGRAAMSTRRRPQPDFPRSLRGRRVNGFLPGARQDRRDHELVQQTIGSSVGVLAADRLLSRRPPDVTRRAAAFGSSTTRGSNQLFRDSHEMSPGAQSSWGG